MTSKAHTAQMKDENPLTDSFGHLAEETIAQWHVPGLSIAVVDGDQTWTKGYGVAAYPSTEVTPDTLFSVGSTTKAFTSAALALLVEDNDKFPHVQWDTPVHQLIPDDFVLSDSYATTRVTIEDILSHRTGLPRHDMSYGKDQKATTKEIVRSLRHLPLTAELRTKFQYNNLMFVVAGHVVETVTGQSIGDFLTERIWQPLGMDHTFMTLQDVSKGAKDDLLARGYYHDGEKYDQVTWMPIHEVAAAGSMISNVVDYTKWIRALIGQKGPLSSTVCKALWEPRTVVPSEEPYTGPQAYGLGWQLGTYRGQRFYEHAGATQAYGAQLIIFPDLEYGIVSFANTADTSNTAEKVLLYHLIDEKLNVPKESRFDWNKHGLSLAEKRKENVQKARQTFYPSIPSPPLPSPVPLTALVGKYHHPAYQYLNIYLDESGSCLRADRKDTVWPQFFRFEHISGAYFLAHVQYIGGVGAFFLEVCPVEFRIGPDGLPSEVGIRWEEAMKDDKIWLRRLE